MRKTIILGMFIVLLLAGCIPTETTPSQEDIRKGTKGVEVAFTQNSPPRSVYEEESFRVGATLTNEGAYQAEPYVTLSVEDDYIEMEETNKGISIKGKSSTSPEGGRDTLYFDAAAKEIPGQLKKHPTTIIMSVCYSYKTFLTEQLCINPNPASDDVCKETKKSQNSQGAPVAITGLETRMQKTKDEVYPVITIDVNDKGRGTVIKNDEVKKGCSAEKMRRNELNVVKLSKLTVGNNELGKDIECEEEITLRNGRGRFTCKFKEPIDASSPAYEAQTEIELEYGYSRSVSENVDIERSI